MTTRMLLSNIASFALQVSALVITAAALARLFRIDRPGVMLAYWRAVLLACLLLPLGQPWHVVIPPPLASSTTTATVDSADVAVTTADTLPRTALRSSGRPIGDFVLMTLAAGIAARALWLAIGAIGLRRLRRDASPLEPLPESVRHAQQRVGAEAGMFVSDRVSGPITFGLRRPVVVFPPRVSTMPPHVQEAVTYHELLHVQRRDWVHEVLEEAVRALLWFHPAIWWLIGRIQLTREQVVDEAAIKLTESRERYIESLLAVALGRSPHVFTPASAFLRRHLLKKRVARILQETTMTTRRLIASLTASTAVLALAAVFAVRAFPLEAQGRVPVDTGEPIQLVAGGEHLLHGARPDYPRRAVEQKVEGDVVVELTLDTRGEVSDARIVSGPDELRKATLEAVLQWHYSPSALSSTVAQATLRFKLPAEGLLKGELAKEVLVKELLFVKAQKWNDIKLSPDGSYAFSRHTDGPLMDVGKALEDPGIKEDERAALERKHFEMAMALDKMHEDAKGHHQAPFEVKPDDDHQPSDEFHRGDVAVKVFRAGRHLAYTLAGEPRLADVRTEHVSPGIGKELLAQAGVAIGDAVTEDIAKRIRQVALEMDEHFHVEFERADKDGVVITIAAK